jgi:aminoglycoside 3-N-acetyltransferase
MRNCIRKITPNFLLQWYRNKKKNRVRQTLEKQKQIGQALSQDDLVRELKEMGVSQGDHLLVHSSLSKLGYVDGGAATVVNALLTAVGDTGNLLMPNSPNASFQLDYIQNLPYFDVLNSPSKLGSITEYHRLHPQSVRSWHPTEPVSCIGPDADFYVSGHFGELTPYTKKSPFYKVSAQKGKILMIGVTLDNAGTNLHTLEDAVADFVYPIYYPELFTVKIIDPKGEIHTVQTKVHNPEWSKKRRCDELIPLFEKEGALRHTKLGNAKCLLIDAHRFFQVMLANYMERGVTMYTPQGKEG